MSIQLKIGPDAISSYKRLAYTAWHAIAEFVDNSTQSYFDNQAVLDAEYAKTGDKLEVNVIYSKDESGGMLRISDNAMGMDRDELERALHVALPPTNTSGRSKYGMGMKTAACWIGNRWTVTTKKLGETVEYSVTVDVSKVAAGNVDLDYSEAKGKNPEIHYTQVEITEHNRRVWGSRTLGKIKMFLRSMYREDFRANRLRLTWQGTELNWEEFDANMLAASDGSRYKKPFEFEVDGKKVTGWVGILDHGSRADAGFSIIHSGRVVKGWPDAWRPQSLYGQLQGSNDLVNQRLVGEIHLDPFEVSHTKDDILWLGTQEEEVEEQLKKHCGDYRDVAKKPKKGRTDERGPSEIEIKTALDELKRELESPEMVDQINIETIPPEAAIHESKEKVIKSVKESRQATFKSKIEGVCLISGFLTADMSPNDPYVLVEATGSQNITVIVNAAHPYFGQLKGAEGVLDYLRQCTFDAIAEWKARNKASSIDPDTIKIIKDSLLRVPMIIEQHDEPPEEAESISPNAS